MPRKLLLLYLSLLLLSQLVGALRPAREVGRPDYQLMAMPAELPADRQVQLCYLDLPAAQADAPVLLLLHGSPGSSRDFDQLAEQLGDRFRLLIPDLPGFGRSSLELPDYSFASHASYVQELLERLDSGPVHVVAFSMGGGVALNLAHEAPELLASLSLVSALGVQELELFGHYELNHAVHGFQLFVFQLARWLTPHFGSLDRTPVGKPYVRNFFDSDQRPLRGMLEEYPGPALIIHGVDDFLVPVEAAREHVRLLPQSEAQEWSANHFLPWTHAEPLAAALADFVERTERGATQRRSQADPARIAKASAPWDPADTPPLTGAALIVAMLLLAAATLVSEDLTCIATGLLVAQGRIEFLPGVAACFLGIFIGDGLLFLAGRWLGRPALTRIPLRWVVRPAAVLRAEEWFRHRGGRVILLSRFMPGLRLPTYVAAGMLGIRLRSFVFYFALAGLLWTPLLVGISTWAGREVLAALHAFEGYALPVLVLLALALLVAQRLIVPLFSHRGRRLLYGAYRRRTEWEFLPIPIFYFPITLYIGWLALRYRNLRLVTLVNPGIFSGGLVGESKGAIMQALGCDTLAQGGTTGLAKDFLPCSLLLPGSAFGGQPSGEPCGQTGDGPGDKLGGNDPTRTRLQACRRFMAEQQLDYPIVIKPDLGERGHGVEILHDEAQLDHRLQTDDTDLLLQEYLHGEEFGVFYYRFPGKKEGTIYSINKKHFLHVQGDGVRTLEQLILDHDRAVRLASVHFDYHAARLYDVPKTGLEITLVDIGAHARGTVFLDACELATPALRASMDQIADAMPGFHFGRIDLRAPDAAALQQGKDLRILEINGLSAEAAHIYDPKHGVIFAWKVLCRQWKLAFTIAAENRKAGAQPASYGELWRAWRNASREHRNRARTATCE